MAFYKNTHSYTQWQKITSFYAASGWLLVHPVRLNIELKEVMQAIYRLAFKLLYARARLYIIMEYYEKDAQKCYKTCTASLIGHSDTGLPISSQCLGY
jgi:hypothetical protein